MDSNSSSACRLCFKASDNSVNIFDKFQDSTIASILTQHFWFQVILFRMEVLDNIYDGLLNLQVCKNDGLSESLCQICWTNTETFHNFYKEVERLQREYWESVELIERESDDPDGTVGKPSSSDSIKKELSFAEEESEPDMNIIKCEETEPTTQIVDLVIVNEGTSDYNDDDSCGDQSNVSVEYFDAMS